MSYSIGHEIKKSNTLCIIHVQTSARAWFIPPGQVPISEKGKARKKNRRRDEGEAAVEKAEEGLRWDHGLEG